MKSRSLRYGHQLWTDGPSGMFAKSCRSGADRPMDLSAFRSYNIFDFADLQSKVNGWDSIAWDQAARSEKQAPSCAQPV